MLARVALLFAIVAYVSALPESPCEPVSVQQDFNITKYASHRWYIQRQQAIKYLPVNERYCVVATYEQTDATHLKVHNYANIGQVNGKVDNSDEHVKALGGICGKATSESGKLEVGPCDLSIISPFAFGPYWVVAAGDDNCVSDNCPQPEDYTWAFVSGGQPTIKTDNGCTPGTGVNNAGMWIFSKASERNQTQVDMINAIGTQKGFDMSQLGDVEQAGCKYAPGEVADVTANTNTAKCCEGKCPTAGMEKYWSLASGIFGGKHCGEACMYPKDYNLYHFFEKNLTKSEVDYPCMNFGYTKYDSTVTHGFPPVTMTLDLYDLPSEQ